MVKTLLKDIQLVAELGCKPRQPDSKTQAPNYLTMLSGRFTWDLPGMWGYIIMLSFLHDVDSSMQCPLLFRAGME